MVDPAGHELPEFERCAVEIDGLLGQVLPRLVERLSPLTILASTTGGDVRLTGLLSGWVWQKGSVAEARGQTGSCELVDPVPGTVLQLPTRSGETGSVT